MAYLVLALGAFLSIGGALSIYHGAGIVEVERGWTGVIAGATALTGGIVTIALGLILKTLLDLRVAGSHPAALPFVPPADAGEPHAEDRTDREPSLAAPVGEPTSLMTAELESGMLAAILAPPQVATEAERPFGAPAERPKVRSLPVAGDFEPASREHESPLSDPAVFDRESETDELKAEEPVAEKSRFKIGFKRTPAALPPEPAPIAAVEPEEPAMDDWLDRAFSALDNEPPLGPTRATTPPHDAAHDVAAHDVADDRSIHAEAASAIAEPPPQAVHEEPHEPAPPQPEAPLPPAAPTSAVIGRYEADGTSYVMYADGSIEAQSDAGVYRFSSMTELKAFIESAET